MPGLCISVYVWWGTEKDRDRERFGKLYSLYQEASRRQTIAMIMTILEKEDGREGERKGMIEHIKAHWKVQQ